MGIDLWLVNMRCNMGKVKGQVGMGNFTGWSILRCNMG